MWVINCSIPTFIATVNNSCKTEPENSLPSGIWLRAVQCHTCGVLSHSPPRHHTNRTLVIVLSRPSWVDSVWQPCQWLDRCTAIFSWREFLEEEKAQTRKDLTSVSPRSLWFRTWMTASPDFSSSASSGLSEIFPSSRASFCAPTGSVWRWPVWHTWQQKHKSEGQADRPRPRSSTSDRIRFSCRTRLFCWKIIKRLNDDFFIYFK